MMRWRRCVPALLAALLLVAVAPRGVAAAPDPGFPPDPAAADSYRGPAASAGPLPAAVPGPGPLLVGVGRADITPPTGYFLMGWERSDARSAGVQTRLFARAVVLAENGHKAAFVVEDLNGIAGGILQDALTLVADPQLTEQTVLVSATHTHSGPSGYWNFPGYNTVFPTLATPTTYNLSGTRDDQLYSFEVRQLAAALRAADADLAPGLAAWAHRDIVGLTQNRSLEAHLANFGINEGYGTGTVGQDPGGYVDTIDPALDVLRVDKLVGGRDVPVGLWSSFANHGTVDKATFTVYTGDHHGAADRAVEAAIRTRGGVAPGQDVVAAFANADEGDQSSGLRHSGPADAERVGDVEAHAMLDAWTEAGGSLRNDVVIDQRWTRVALPSASTSTGNSLASSAVPGLSLFTGSEEGRGPLYDVTCQAACTNFEGQKLPADLPGGQGDKIQIQSALLSSTPQFPSVLPVTALRLGDRLVATIPGEMTVEMARRVRAAVLAAAPHLGVARVVIDGLTNEYMQYFTTPQEYEAQHYEGGSTLWGEYQSYAILDALVALAHALDTGGAAPAPADDDARNGVTTGATAAPFGTGASSATATAEPATTQRLARATFSWQGAPSGADMPLGRALVGIVRLTAAGPLPVTDDLGEQIVWRVDAAGVYTAAWEIPLDAATGTYAFTVTANHYAFVSSPFAVVPSTRVVLSAAGAGAVHAGYPAAVENTDITARPDSLDGGTLDGRSFSGARLTATSIAAGAVLDAFGNCNGQAYGGSGTVDTCPATTGSTTAAGGATAASPNTAGAAAPAAEMVPAAVLLLCGIVSPRRRRPAAR